MTLAQIIANLPALVVAIPLLLAPVLEAVYQRIVSVL